MKTESSLKGKVDFAVITIREDENKAFLQRLPNTSVYPAANRSYIISRLTLSDNSEYVIAVVRSIEQGEGHAQDVARDAIEDLDPTWLLLVGIAGGVPTSEFTLGDVVLATRLADFSVTAALEGRSAQLAAGGGPMHKQVQDRIALIPAMTAELGDWNTLKSIGIDTPAVDFSVENLYGDNEWRQKVKQSIEHHFPKSKPLRLPLVTTGTNASSDTLVKDSQLIKQWQEASRQIVAVEMELAGVYIAARRMSREYPVLAIRGISDIVGFRRHADWTEYACQSAAAFAYAFLLTKPTVPKMLQSSPEPTIGDAESVTPKTPGSASRYSLDIAMAATYWNKQVDQLMNSSALLHRVVNPSQPPSDLLPYLLDRSEQDDQLIRALFQRRAEKPRCPVVGIVHGDERECHSDFLRKLRQVSLPKILASWYPQDALSTPIAHYELQVPLNKLEVENAVGLLKNNLLAALNIASQSLNDAVSFLHQQHKLAVVMNWTLLTQDLSETALKKVDLFLQFWNDWEELPEDLLLFLCVDFKYQKRFDRRKRILFWSTGFSNDHVRNFIHSLDFTAYRRIFGFCFPELEAIPRSDLDAMLQIDLIHRFYRFKESDIRDLYNNAQLINPDGRIPMEALIDSLDAIHRQTTLAFGV